MYLPAEFYSYTISVAVELQGNVFLAFVCVFMFSFVLFLKEKQFHYLGVK